MAYRLTWTRLALDDLGEIVRYIARDNRAAAEKLGSAIIARAEGLSEHPRMGRVVPEAGEEHVREVILRPYRLIYELDDATETLVISRVWRAARGAPELPPSTSL